MIPMIQTDHLVNQLQKYFKLSAFRTGQREIVEDIIRGNDVLGVLPTGSGKSLCYQLPAKILDGATIVVSPLISLMMDQVKQLRSAQFKEVIAFNSFMDLKERKYALSKIHTYKLIYVSPEILQNKQLLHHLKKIKISLFVIDEAHCISQWGPEFRTDYLKLSPIIQSLNNPTLLALSATATEAVQQDIIDSLHRKDFKKHIYPMDRENIAFCINKVAYEAEKLEIISSILKNKRLPTLIYFSSRAVSEQVALTLSEQIPSLRIAFYHSGMEPMDRTIVQQQFMNDQLDVICSTSAFGMGINKSNIRLVIHYHFPSQLESYIQEIGRAGRDGNSSVSLLLYLEADRNIPNALIQSELPSKGHLTFVFKQLYNYGTKNTVIPSDETQIEELFSVNETQWRFLHYQLEKHGIVSNNMLLTLSESDWKIAFQHINHFRKERQEVKEKQLNEIIEWIAETDCLRHKLYTKFQHTYKNPTDHCCSNCGFSFTNWNPKQIFVENNKNISWVQKLEDLLLVGARNESKRNN